MKRIFLFTSIAFFGLFIAVSESNGQIPSIVPDLLSLSKVSWGMKMDQVEKNYGSKMSVDSDSTLHFDDLFLESKVKVNLTFGKHPDFEGLKFVEVQFDDKDFGEKLFAYLKTRYGEKFESKAEEKTKLFITILLESKKWTLDKERVLLITISKGSEILALNLLYGVTKKDHK